MNRARASASGPLAWLLPIVFVGCAQAQAPDTGFRADATGDRSDGTTLLDVADTGVAMEAAVDARLDARADAAADVRDVPDVPVALDVADVTDTGPRSCVATCTMASECTNSCPIPISGNIWCCGSGFCSSVTGTSCGSVTTPDSGSSTGLPNGVSCTGGAQCASGCCQNCFPPLVSGTCADPVLGLGCLVGC